MYSAFISIILISIIIVSWTTYTFITQSSKSSEIINLIQDMYKSQKSVVIDVIDLSKILVKDTSESIDNEKNNLLIETEIMKDVEGNSQLDELLTPEDNGDNPLGIVIEQSLPEGKENSLPDERTKEPLLHQQREFSLTEIEKEMDMDINS